MLITSFDDECKRVPLPELISCGSAVRIESSGAPCGRLLFAEFTVWISSASSFSSVRSPMAKIEVACFARLTVLRALLAVLDSARSTAAIPTFSVV